MIAGPIFSREVRISPRQLRHYLMRAGYVAALFVLMYTAGQATFGWQEVRNIGDTARFGSLIFQVFSLIQLSLVIFAQARGWHIPDRKRQHRCHDEGKRGNSKREDFL